MKRLNRALTACVTALAVVAVGTACNRESTAGSTTIGYSTYTVSNPFFAGMQKGLDSGSAQALADLAFVLIHFRRIDVAIAEPQGFLDHARASASPQRPGAEPERRDARPIGLDDRNRRRSGTHGAVFSKISLPISMRRISLVPAPIS